MSLPAVRPVGPLRDFTSGRGPSSCARTPGEDLDEVYTRRLATADVDFHAAVVHSTGRARLQGMWDQLEPSVRLIAAR